VLRGLNANRLEPQLTTVDLTRDKIEGWKVDGRRAEKPTGAHLYKEELRWEPQILRSTIDTIRFAPEYWALALESVGEFRRDTGFEKQKKPPTF
jgi:hypothetical protein